MEIKVDVDGSDYMVSMFEAVTVQNLKWDLLAWETTGYVHANDMEAHNKRIEAAKVLIKWYSGEEDKSI
jgi:hypothetical protein